MVNFLDWYTKSVVHVESAWVSSYRLLCSRAMRSSFSLFLAALTRIGLLWDAEAALLEGLILRTEGKTRGWPEIIGLALRTRFFAHATSFTTGAKYAI